MNDIEKLLKTYEPLPNVFADSIGSKLVGEGKLGTATRYTNGFMPYGFYDVRLVSDNYRVVQNLDSFLKRYRMAAKNKILLQIYKADEYEIKENTLGVESASEFKFVAHKMSSEKEAHDKGEMLRNIE
tara:strand:+ start:1512 stop:1895 length:384 start_codon:yes stop_codon:yes gene_type:complete